MIKKVCFFLGHYDPARQAIMNYYEKVLPKDLEIFIACASKFDYEKYKLKRAKVKEILDKKFIVPLKLRKFCKEKNIDLLINLTGQAEVALTLFTATAFTKTKSTFYVLGNPKINLKNSFFLFSQFFTDRFLSCCKEVADKLGKYLIFSRNKNFYLPFPIDTKLFKKNNTNLRKTLGLKKEDNVIIYVGRIEFAQGSDYLQELVKKNPDKKFLFIGQWKDETFKSKNFKNIIYIPYVLHEELSDYYNLADLTLFFSKRNSYPYPPRESLACEVPVILFNLDTFGQLKTLAVKKVPFNLEKIQQEINKFFSLSKKERENLSKEGRSFIVKDSSEESVKNKTLKYLLEF